MLTFLIAFGPMIIPQRYSSNENLVDDKNTINLISQNSSFSPQDVEAFLTGDGSIITRGRLLYPRFFRTGAGIHHKPSLPFFELDFNRVEFVLLNEDLVDVYFPTSRQQKDITHASDVIVMGCKEEKSGVSIIKAFFIISFDRDGHTSFFQAEHEELLCNPSVTNSEDY